MLKDAKHVLMGTLKPPLAPLTLEFVAAIVFNFYISQFV
jgi:hypothetical protein